MNNSVLPQNSVIRGALGRNVTKKNISHWVPPSRTKKNNSNWKNTFFGWMKNFGAQSNNNTSTINGSEAQSVYNTNIKSMVSPVNSYKRSNNLINEELQLGTLNMPKIPLASIKDKAVKEWFMKHPGDYKRILEAWNRDKPSQNAILPPSYVSAKVLEMMRSTGQEGGRRRRRNRRNARRKTRRSNRK